jgi:hypothetical protein
LEGIVNLQACGPTFGAGIVVTVLDLLPTACYNYERNVSITQSLAGGGVAQVRSVNLTLLPECLDQAVRARWSHDRYCRPVWCPVSEGEAQACREEDRENEDPEDRLGLSEELTIANPRKLNQRMLGPAAPALSHRADSCR